MNTDINQDVDPFSMVYTALWGLIKRNPRLETMIPISNRIDFTEQGSEKPNISDADTPELMLIQSDFSFIPKLTTRDQVGITRAYIWSLTTGDLRINRTYNRVSFELLRSLVDYECVICPLQWCGHPFVNELRQISVQEGKAMHSVDKHIPGWSALWGIEVDFQFCRSILRLPTIEDS